MEILITKKKTDETGAGRQWEPTTLLAVRLGVGKHKAALIKSLLTPCAPETITSQE